MHDHIDTILTELEMLDPSWKGDANVRQIVEALITQKPSITIDPEFVRSLRAKLIYAQTVQKPAPSPFMHALMMRVAPLSAVALLLLILVPQFMTRDGGEVDDVVRTPRVPSTSYTSSPESQSVSAPAMDTMGAPTPDMDAKMLAPFNESAMTAESGTDYISNAVLGFALTNQPTGEEVIIDYIELENDGAVLFVTNSNGEIVGKSIPLSRGPTRRVHVSLTTSMKAGETYSVEYSNTIPYDDVEYVTLRSQLIPLGTFTVTGE